MTILNSHPFVQGSMNRGLQILLSKYEHLDFDVSQRNGCKGKLLGSMTPSEALEYENISIITNQEVYFTRQESGGRDSVRTEDDIGGRSNDIPYLLLRNRHSIYSLLPSTTPIKLSGLCSVSVLCPSVFGKT